MRPSFGDRQFTTEDKRPSVLEANSELEFENEVDEG